MGDALWEELWRRARSGSSQTQITIPATYETVGEIRRLTAAQTDAPYSGMRAKAIKGHGLNNERNGIWDDGTVKTVALSTLESYE